MLRDKLNKHAYADSAQVACEAAGAIRTVASLTREEAFVQEYSDSLEGPLQNATRAAVWSNAMYAITQSMTFWAIALVGFCFR